MLFSVYRLFRTLLFHGIESDWLEDECEDEVFRKEIALLVNNCESNILKDSFFLPFIIFLTTHNYLFEQEGRAGAKDQPGP